jgi:uncharacterized membrane protein YiaA
MWLAQSMHLRELCYYFRTVFVLQLQQFGEEQQRLKLKDEGREVEQRHAGWCRLGYRLAAVLVRVNIFSALSSG